MAKVAVIVALRAFANRDAVKHSKDSRQQRRARARADAKVNAAINLVRKTVNG